MVALGGWAVSYEQGTPVRGPAAPDNLVSERGPLIPSLLYHYYKVRSTRLWLDGCVVQVSQCRHVWSGKTPGETDW